MSSMCWYANLKHVSTSKSALKSFLKHWNPSSTVSTLSLLTNVTALTWRIVYIGQASNPAYDVVLQEAEMGCEQAGQMRFVLEADAPNPQQLPEQDIVGVTAVLLTCSYKDN